MSTRQETPESTQRAAGCELGASPCSAFNDQCHDFFKRQYAAMNLDDKTDFTRFEAMATVETFLHSIGVMGKPNESSSATAARRRWLPATKLSE